MAIAISFLHDRHRTGWSMRTKTLSVQGMTGRHSGRSSRIESRVHGRRKQGLTNEQALTLKQDTGADQ